MIEIINFRWKLKFTKKKAYEHNGVISLCAKYKAKILKFDFQSAVEF